MKILCITGPVQSTLDRFSILLEAAGAAPAELKPTMPEMSIKEWHRGAIQTISNPEIDSSKPIALSRAWKKQASDILTHHKNASVWFWADKNSTRFLDFWLRINNKTHFILIYTSPHIALLEAAKNQAVTERYLAEVLQDWSRHTRAMLRFHLRTQERSIVLSSETPYTEIREANQRWNLSLSIPEETRDDLGEFSSLDIYLAKSIVERNPEIVKLHEQLLSITSKQDGADNNDIQAEIYKALNLRFRHNLEPLSKTVKPVIQTANKKINFGLVDSTDIDLATKQQSSPTPEEHVSESENAQLLQQLHMSQENQERFLQMYTAKKNELDTQNFRVNRLLENFPNYWDVEAILVVPISSVDGSQIAQWTLKNIYINNRLISEISLQTHLVREFAGVIIDRNTNKNADDEWIKWPEAYANSDKLPCIPNSGGLFQDNNAVLSSFGTTDWASICTLVSDMLNALSAEDDRFQIEVDKNSLIKGLLNLHQTLINWPTILRYDSIHLNNASENNEYQRLEISVTNLSLANYTWPLLDYRLSTVDKSNTFGENPRLEFLESTGSAFENWSFENDELQGPRLEVRFAYPNAMDTHVWGRLSSKDQILVAGIINSLPQQLTRLQKNEPLATLHWDNWHELGKAVREILRYNFTRLSSVGNLRR